MLTRDDVIAARRTIAGQVHHTPLVGSAALSARIGAPLFLKLENFQKTGSFKARGVLNRIAALGTDQRPDGLITASAGNHAQALAWAAGVAGLPCTVVMPATAPTAKIEATRGYGGDVVLEPNVLTVFERAHAIAAERNLTFVPPFDDPHVVAGAGTVGLEILDDLPDVATIVVPIGGGGLIAGMALVAKTFRPQIRVIGVEPEGAAAMWQSHRAGNPVRLDRVATIADGLGAPFAGAVPFEIVEQYVDDLVLVDDEQIRAAMILLLERCKLLAEPAGAAGLAALLAGTIPASAGPIVTIISGGNVDAARLANLLSASA